MSEPIVAADAPVRVELEAGTYWWCRCGRSSNQPWCDGSHEGTGIEPMEFEVKRPKKLWLCQCKRTAAGPYCDGAHNRPSE